MAVPLKKILINNTASTMQILNRDIAPGGQYDVPAGLWHKLYDDQTIPTKILNGDIIVNDGTNNLSATAGEQHIYKWQPTDPNYSPGRRAHIIQFQYESSGANVWMERSTYIQGNRSKWSPPVDLKILKLVFTNRFGSSAANPLLVRIRSYYKAYTATGNITTNNSTLDWTIEPTSSNTERWSQNGRMWVYDASSLGYEFLTANAYAIRFQLISGNNTPADMILEFYCEEK